MVLFWDFCIGTHDISLGQVDEVLEPVDAINSLNNMRDTVLIFHNQEVSKVKAQILKKAGLLELHRPAKFSELGGLDSLKDYIINRSKAITSDDPGLPRPKAFLPIGVPGTGKSLGCKAVASILNWQLVRLDIGALKGSLGLKMSERFVRQPGSWTIYKN